MTEAPHLPRGAVPDPPVPPGVDPAKPSPARLYDYYLGGRNNFEADRKVAEGLRQSLPELSDAAWANRGFHQRAAVVAGGRRGLRQFIDIGSGLPTVGNTHQVVQRVEPDARVVYVDHRPDGARPSPGRCWPARRTSRSSPPTCGIRTRVLGHPAVRSS